LIPKTVGRVEDVLKYPALKNKLFGIEKEAEKIGTKLESTADLEKSMHEEANALKNKSYDEISSHLNLGAHHGVRGAKSIANRIESIENYWKSGFKDLRNKLKTSEFKMQKLPDFGDDMLHAIKNIKDLEIKNGKLVIKNQPEVSRELQSIIDKAPTPKDVTADNFLTKYQDFRDARYDLLQRAKIANTAQERKALFKAYEDSKPIEQSVKSALEQGLGEHSPEFKRINEGYSEQIYPLRNNKVVQKALKGKLGANTIEDLAGFGEGQELLRDIVKQDPELLRNIVGQRYAAKPQGLHEIDESAAEFLNEMPELKKILNEHEVGAQKQLAEINKLKEEKNINLKKKIELENQAKELKLRLDRINKDKARIYKGAKTTGKVAVGLALGSPLIGKLISKYTGN